MKKILVFSNMDQIGDGIIKLPFLHKIKNRFPEHHFIWVTHAGNSVFNSLIKNIANQYIDEIYEIPYWFNAERLFKVVKNGKLINF